MENKYQPTDNETKAYGEAQVFDTAYVYGEAQALETAHVYGKAKIFG